MKKILLFVVAPFIMFSCSNNEPKPEPDKELEKYIHIIQIDRIDYKFGEPDLSDKRRVAYKKFDESENLLSNDSMNIDRYNKNYYYSQFNYTYNNKNQLIELKKNDLSDKRIEYLYNVDGTLNSEKIYTKNGLGDIITYTYENGKLSKKEEDGIIINVDYYSLYEYNSKGLISEQRQYRASDGSLFYSYRFEYDNHGNLIKKTNISPTGKEQVVLDDTYRYDEQGRCIEHIKKTLMGDIDIHQYTYNEEDGLLERMDFIDGKTNEKKYYHEYKYSYKEKEK